MTRNEVAAVSFAPLTPPSFLRRRAAAFPEKTAVADGDAEISWAAFAEGVSCTAGDLRDGAIAPGGRVAAPMPNRRACLTAHFA